MIPVLMAIIILSSAAGGAMFETRPALMSFQTSNGAWMIIFQPVHDSHPSVEWKIGDKDDD